MRPACSKVHVKVVLAGAALLSFACAFPIPLVEMDAPRVLHASPVGSATTTPLVSVTFSKPVLHEKLTATNAFVLVKTEEITSTFLSDLASPPLIASRQALVVPGTLSVSDDSGTTVLTFFPSRPLDGETSYSYLVSRSVTDEHDRPLVIPMLDGDGEIVRYPDTHPTRPGETVLVAGNFQASFVTGQSMEVEGPHVVERLPGDGARNVPSNLASVMVRFSEPAYNVTTASFQLLGDGAAVPASSVDLTEGRTRAELFVSGELAVSSEYRVVLRSSIQDSRGNPLDEALNQSTFTTAACRDDDEPVIHSDSIDVLALDSRAIIRWRTTEPSTSLVRYGLSVPELEVWGEVGRCTIPSYDPCADPPMDAVCSHEVRIEGLVPETSYVFDVESTDVAGNVARSDVKAFQTMPPLPPLVVNEIMATPDVAPQEEAEFVEVFNAGTEPVDLDGWIIADSSAVPARTNALSAFATASTILEPGGYAVIVGQAFDASHYPHLATNVILAGPGNRLLTYGLADDRGLLIELRSPEGATVSTFGGWYRGRDNRGRSIERIDPAGSDARENWTWALHASGATPGSKNSVTP